MKPKTNQTTETEVSVPGTVVTGAVLPNGQKPQALVAQA